MSARRACGASSTRTAIGRPVAVVVGAGLLASAACASASTTARPAAAPSRAVVSPLDAPPTTPTADVQAGRYVAPSPTRAEGCRSRDGLPDPACTPGATDAAVTEATLAATVCRAGGGYSASVRPPVAVTGPIKIERRRAYGLGAEPLAALELDHLVPLSLGGAPGGAGHGGVANLWPQRWEGPDGARVKDRLELRLLDLVCSRRLDLSTAQRAIATDWMAALRRYGE